MIAPGTIRQRSEFRFEDRVPRPLRYTFDDGTKRTDRDVKLDFEWSAGRARGVAEDVSVDVALVPELQDAATMTVLATAQLRAGVLPRFDLVMFDACLMAHLETAVAVMDSADWLCASQASVPGTGYPYGQVLPLFAQHQDGGAVAKGVVAAFADFYEHAQEIDGRQIDPDSTVTQSAIDLSRVPRIAHVLETQPIREHDDHRGGDGFDVAQLDLDRAFAAQAAQHLLHGLPLVFQDALEMGFQTAVLRQQVVQIPVQKPVAPDEFEQHVHEKPRVFDVANVGRGAQQFGQCGLE